MTEEPHGREQLGIERKEEEEEETESDSREQMNYFKTLVRMSSGAPLIRKEGASHFCQFPAPECNARPTDDDNRYI